MEDASFDLLWGKEAAPARGPRPSLRRRDVVMAGVAIADSEGLAGVTMSAVAQRLGLTPMALYRYVPNKDALIDLMADAVMRRPPKLAGRRWRADISAWAYANLAMILRHPWLSEIVRTRVSIGPNWTRWLDSGLGALAPLKFSVSEKMAVLLSVDGHFRAAAQIMIGAKATRAWAENFDRMLDAVAEDARYPALSELVARGAFADAGLDLDGMFQFGLDRLLDGVDALARERAGKG